MIKKFIAGNRERIFGLGVIYLILPICPLLAAPLIAGTYILAVFVYPFFNDDLYRMLYHCSQNVVNGEIFNYQYKASYPGDEGNMMSRTFLKGSLLVLSSFWMIMLFGWGINKLIRNRKKTVYSLGVFVTALAFWFPFSVLFSMFYMASQYTWSMGFTWWRLLGITYSFGGMFVLIGFFLWTINRRQKGTINS
jgi:hypothetical protein